jgi:hypothetical protein
MAIGLDKIQYRQCTGTGGTQLQRFYFMLTYPYAYFTLSAPNYPSCAIHVCDILLGVATVVNPTTLTATDGSITMAATSSGSVRYSLTNQDYAAMTNTTGIFTGLGVGNYVVYAADSFSCRAAAPIIALSITYGVKYRQEYNDYFGRATRVDISEKNYSGGVTDAISASEPIGLSLRGENGDLFDSVIGSEMVQNLISSTNFQYLGLYTGDERKYQVIYYKNLGSGLTELWRGFIKPILYQEKYDRDTNYQISVHSTDQLATLKDIDFLYDSGAKIIGTFSLMQIIALILLKTDLNLPIRSAINIYESAMVSTATDDPLTQTYIDALTYDGMNCMDVLSNILGAFGAGVRQYGGYWLIRRKAEESAAFYYRQYSSVGVYVSGGTGNIVTTAWKWEGRSQMMEVIGSRSAVEITQQLKVNPYYFDNGGFENDITGGFTLVNNGNSAYFNIVQPGNESGNAIIVFSDGVNATYGSDAYIQFSAKPLILDGSETLRFSFDFFPDSDVGKIYSFVKFKFSLRVGTWYLQSDGTWSASNQWTEVVVTDQQFNSWQTFEASVKTPLIGTTDTDVRIMVGGGPGISPQGRTWYYANDAALQAVATTTLPRGYITAIYEEAAISFLTTHSFTKTRFYQLTYGTNATSTPDYLRPTDYNAVTNTVVWKNVTNGLLFQSGEIDYTNTLPPWTKIDGPTGSVRIFDNIALQVMPKGNPLADSKTHTFVSNVNNKKKFTKDFINGDSPTDVISGANSYTNVFKLSTGAKTGVWKRRTTTENLMLLSLLAKQIGEQTYTPKFKLTGQLRGTTGGAGFFGFDTCFSEIATGKKYSIAAMTIRDKMCSYDVELHEIIQETANGVISEFATAEFSLTELGTSIRFNP